MDLYLKAVKSPVGEGGEVGVFRMTDGALQRMGGIAFEDERDLKWIMKSFAKGKANVHVLD